MTIRVCGVPAPQGSKSFRGISKSGKGIMVESSKAVKPWREAVKWAALEAKNGAAPLSGPIHLDVVFFLARPKSVKRVHPEVKPDLSKLLRSTEDALTDAGIYFDDAQIIKAIIEKRYASRDDTTGAIITVTPR